MKADGSGAHCWGNVPHISNNAKVAIGTYNNGLAYAVCHEHGGFTTNLLPSSLLDTMHTINGKAGTIHSIFLAEDQEYFILCDDSWSWRISNEHLQKELKKTGDSVCFVSIFSNGQWAVFRENSFIYSIGFPAEASSHIQKHYDDQKKMMAQQEKRVASYRRAIAAFEQGG